jgi:menaquinone-specific isochorismate synthase
VETAAIAGTAPRADGVADDARLARELLESDKNLHEHRLVIASIERRLRQVGVEPSTPASPRLMTLATVQHLHTPITGRLPGGRHLLELVEALHPTPAMGGRPRDVVLPRLREFETFERGLYAGPMGWVRHDGEGEFVVGIRAGVLRGRQAELYAGVGIVSGSDPAGEWRETEWKLAAMRDALGGHAR